ncbi:MAG TPA: serine hydrolase [Chitinophagaceae bacterium]|nr:serine hydrolase [Chitinophagaceae bacterium]
MKKFVITLFLAVGFFWDANAQTSLPEEVRNNIKVRIENGINTGIVVGIIDADGSHYYSYGVKSKKSMEPVNEYSVFEIGSITKTFTGILLADMVIKGEVNLDDPLQKYLPAGVTAPTRNGMSINLVHLANHTSSLPGMPDNFKPANPANPFADYSEKQLYDFLNTYKLTRDIGSKYEYSNYAAGLLGHVMATKKELTYEKLMINVIASPLKLYNTRITLTPKMKANLAMGHNEGVEVENWDFTTLAGAGAFRSTAVDMLKYLAVNMGIIKSKLYPAMQLSHRNSREEGGNPMVGLGWHKIVSPGLEIIWHNGGTGGYRAFVGFIKGGEKGVVVLSNSNTSVDDIGMHILNPKIPLQPIKNSIAIKLQNMIDAQGIEPSVKAYWDIKKDQGDKYDFSENQLNKLGYDYLRKGEMEKSIAVFSLNAEAYPQSSNAFYNMGEAYMKKSDKEKAIESYKKSISLNPGNKNAIDKLKELGVNASDIIKEVVVDTETLEGYVGQYQLAPGFILTISRQDNQLTAQATGQPEYPIFPKLKNVFYYKVVEAQLTFNQDEKGKIQSVTLRQAGREFDAKKIKE